MNEQITDQIFRCRFDLDTEPNAKSRLHICGVSVSFG